MTTFYLTLIWIRLFCVETQAGESVDDVLQRIGSPEAASLVGRVGLVNLGLQVLYCTIYLYNTLVEHFAGIKSHLCVGVTHYYLLPIRTLRLWLARMT